MIQVGEGKFYVVYGVGWTQFSAKVVLRCVSLASPGLMLLARTAG